MISDIVKSWGLGAIVPRKSADPHLKGLNVAWR